MTADARPLERVPVSTLAARAVQRAFARAAALRCPRPFAPAGRGETLHGLPGCVPYDYLAWGCEVRAHLVCRHLAAGGIAAGKVWLFDRPVTAPRPLAARRLVWEWHVAAFVLETGRRGRDAVRIIDPSFHRRAVSLRALLRRFHASPRRIRFSAATCFQMGPDGRGSPDRVSPRFGAQSDVLLAELRADARHASHARIRGSAARGGRAGT